MSQVVKVSVTSALQQITPNAVGAAFGALAVTLVDSTGGAGATQKIEAASIVADAEGKATNEVSFEEVAVGSFSGTVTMLDTNGTALGTPVSFSGSVPAAPATIAAYVPQTVNVTLG